MMNAKIEGLKDYIKKCQMLDADKDMTYRLISSIRDEFISEQSKARECAVRQDVYAELCNKMINKICETRGGY